MKMKKIVIISLAVAALIGGSLYAQRGAYGNNSGYGYGYHSGYGNGNGYHSGYGNGNGYHSGYGNGNHRGYNSGYGNGNHRGYGHMSGGYCNTYGYDFYNMTDAQRNAVSEIRKGYMEKMYTAKSEMRTYNDKIRIELMKDNPDMKVIDDNIAAVNKLQAQIDKMRIEETMKIKEAMKK